MSRSIVEPCPTCGNLRTATYADEDETVWRCGVCGTSREETK
jgi:ribosomal protein S27AE